MKSIRLVAILTVLLGIGALKSYAHPGHQSGAPQKPWYGYLPKSVLKPTIQLLP